MTKNSGIMAIVFGIMLAVSGIFLFAFDYAHGILQTKNAPITVVYMMMILAGLFLCVIFIGKLSLLKKMNSDDDVLLKWTYIEAPPQPKRQKSIHGNISPFLLLNSLLLIAFLMSLSQIDTQRINYQLAIHVILLILMLAAGNYTFYEILFKQHKSYEAIITTDGVYFLGVLTVWKGLGRRLNYVEVEQIDRQKFLVINYAYSTGRHAGNEIINIPIPLGKEKEADEVTKTLAKHRK